MLQVWFTLHGMAPVERLFYWLCMILTICIGMLSYMHTGVDVWAGMCRWREFYKARVLKVPPKLRATELNSGCKSAAAATTQGYIFRPHPYHWIRFTNVQLGCSWNTSKSISRTDYKTDLSMHSHRSLTNNLGQDGGKGVGVLMEDHERCDVCKVHSNYNVLVSWEEHSRSLHSLCEAQSSSSQSSRAYN